MESNAYIWIPDKEYEWILAEIAEDHGENVSAISTKRSREAVTAVTVARALAQTVAKAGSARASTVGVSAITPSDKDQAKSYRRADLCEFDGSHLEDLEDLCLMNNLHEGPLIHILRRRWLQDQIYTYAGDVLISVNPYKMIPGLYDNPVAYFAAPEDLHPLDEDISESYEKALQPHAYYIANSALRKLMAASLESQMIRGSNNFDQSVIISGESGSGKTEASKHVINFLINVNQKMNQDADPNMILQTDRIKDVIIDSSVVFEAFGNAKTVRNDNSSRFGKYIKLQYTQDNGLISAITETFLLEKSRLVAVGEGERNYHVFYQLLRGLEKLDVTEKMELLLTNVDDFRILTTGRCTVIHTPETDEAEFLALHKALSNVGCSVEEITGLWRILAAILHLGNASFNESAKGNVSEIKITSTTIEHVSSLLGVDDYDLIHALTSQSLTIANRASIKTKTLSVTDSTNNVLGLIKWLYSHVFEWLLNSINHCHSSLITEARQPVKFLGILDIFGFEILGHNSFEQLCINFTNERLQQHFNNHIFKSDQELYIKEGINWSTITYQDNQNVIDMIAKKPTGLLYILEEHCMMNRAPDDMALLRQLNQTHGDNPDHVYVKSRFGTDPIFNIKHFAGVVTYSIDKFISKNNDSLQDDLLELIKLTGNPFLKKVIQVSTTGSPRSAHGTSANADSHTHSLAATSGPTKRGKTTLASAVTVSLQFRAQLDTLIAALKATEPHYIKCIKPNDSKASLIFQSSLTMTQLRYSGILEVVRIRREGFPVRVKFLDFYYRYEIFSKANRGTGWLKPEECNDEQAKQYCQYITSKYLAEDSYQYGYTMIFLRENALNKLQIAMNAFICKYATIIQKEVRRHRWMKLKKLMLQKIVKLQSFIRRLHAKKTLAALVLENMARMKEIERLKAIELERMEIERRRLEEIRIKEEAAKRLREEEENERIRREELEKMVRDEEIRKAAIAEAERVAAETRRTEDARMQLRKAIGKVFRNHQLTVIMRNIHEACEHGDVEYLSQQHVKQYINIPWKYRQYDTGLMTALRHEQLKVVEYLCSDVKQHGYGREILHIAANCCAEKSFYHIFKALENAEKAKVEKEGGKHVDSGADVDITCGWMQKFSPGQRKLKRWCVLRKNRILFYIKKEDKIPRAEVEILPGSTLVRTVEPYSFAIESPSPPGKRTTGVYANSANKSTILIAESEIIATDWCYHIQYQLGVIPLARKSANYAVIEYVNTDIRKDILSIRNSYQGTLLHSLIHSKKLESTSSKHTKEADSSAFSLADWLISNGVVVNDVDSHGKSVIDYAAAFNLPRWVKFFESKLGGSSAISVVATETVVGGDIDGTGTRYANVGYVYMNVYIQRLYHKETSKHFNEDSKSLHVSLKNGKDNLVENTRIIRSPQHSTKQCLFWSNMINFRTPLNLVTPGSTISFKLFTKGSKSPDATFKYVIKPETIQSGLVECLPVSGHDPILVIDITLATS